MSNYQQNFYQPPNQQAAQQQQYYQPPGYNAGGMNYNPQQMKAQMSNPLTAEEKKTLMQDTAFTMRIDPAVMAQAICTHKDNGDFATIPDERGVNTCKICGAVFNPNVVNEEYIKESVDAISNILETVKFIGVDLNGDLVREYFPMKAFLGKLPALFKQCNASFLKYNAYSPANPANQQYNPVTAFSNLVAPGPMGGWGGYPPQQVPYQQPPQYGGGNQYMPGYATPQQAAMVNGGNPYYATPPQQQYQQQPPQQQQQNQYYQPGMPQPPATNEQVTPQPQADINSVDAARESVVKTMSV